MENWQIWRRSWSSIRSISGTKRDTILQQTKKAKLEAQLKQAMKHTRLMYMSAMNGDGVDDLMSRMAMFVRKVKETKQKVAEANEN
mmetsp:Transcript_8046/g.17495  ORF Transcript_8046/g.17495 Transcript_8046/m.17495 type:complete len:86 (+) Transcript_8046:186-443(+)